MCNPHTHPSLRGSRSHTQPAPPEDTEQRKHQKPSDDGDQRRVRTRDGDPGKGPNEDQGIEDMLNHIDYLVDLIGVDHVAIGLDNHFQDQAARHRRQTKARTVAFQRLGIELVANFMAGIESLLE